MRSADRALCAIVIACGLAYGEPAGKWDDVTRLPATTQILVETTANKPLRGTVVSVTDDVVVMKRGGKEESIARNPVIRLAVRTRSHRARNSLIGLALGAAAGFGIAEIHAHTCSGWFCGLDGVVYLPIGVLGGAAAGAAIPTGTWVDVYRTR